MISVALGGVAAIELLFAYALLELSPEIGATLGMPAAAVVSLALVPLAAGGVAALSLADLARRGLRAPAVGAGMAWALSAGVAAVAADGWGLAGALLFAGVALGGSYATRAGAAPSPFAHRATAALGLVAGAALVGFGREWLSWRGILLAITGAALVASAAVALVRIEAATPDGERLPLTTTERLRAVRGTPTIRHLLVAAGAIGAILLPLLGVLLAFLEDRWSLDHEQRAMALAGATAAGLTAAVLLRREAAQRPWAPAFAAMIALALPAVALAPTLVVAVSLVAVVIAALVLLETAVLQQLVEVVPRHDRAAASAAAGAAQLAIGTPIGFVLAGGLLVEAGARVALGALAAPALVAAASVAAARRTAGEDAEERVRGAARAAPAGALATRDLVVYLGRTRALDGIDLTVLDGEAVAITGTNGAGKTTLLRALAGLITPAQGAIYLDGSDATRASAERRADLGVALVSGGSGVFDELTVRESLRLAGPLGSAVERFPRLRDRLDARVVTLSAGERQLLALAQATSRRPRVLLVDELSLGLAPDAIEAVLEIVRREHAAGVTVVVAEQSLALAAAVAPRILFLERGQVRFDGDAESLKGRSDLLRPIFLAGRD